MGIDHRESACSKSSRKPNTKHGTTQPSTTDTCASTSAQSQPGLRAVPAYRMQSQGGERTKAQQDGSLRSLGPEILRMPLTPQIGQLTTATPYPTHEEKQAEEASLYLQHLACKPSPPVSPDDGWGVVPTLPGTCYLQSPTMSTLTQCCLPMETSSYLPWCSKGMLF